jgi:hypothetical protein
VLAVVADRARHLRAVRHGRQVRLDHERDVEAPP